MIPIEYFSIFFIFPPEYFNCYIDSDKLDYGTE